MKVPLPVAFTKMSGTGNDFIIIDHRRPFLAEHQIAEFARSVCRRRFSVGADGLILIEQSKAADFRWQFYNGDGSRAEMCGNGARCAARFAYDHGIAPAGMRFDTDAGIIEAEVVVDDGETVRIRMTPPVDARLNRSLRVAGTELVLHFINTGVPHVVLPVEDVSSAPVELWGREIRCHEEFQPAGTNVNFVQARPGGGLLVRTYERGVEGETMACGTGAVAAAVISALLGRAEPPVTVTTSGGEELTIHFTLARGPEGRGIREAEGIFLEGPARVVYEGRLTGEALL